LEKISAVRFNRLEREKFCLIVGVNNPDMPAKGSFDDQHDPYRRPHAKSLPVAPGREHAARFKRAGTLFQFNFIYGIGAEGMSAFEQALLGKAAGDVFTLRIEKHALPDFFEHLLCPLMEALSITTPMDLEVRVDAVSPATDREMIRALAEKIGGCAGDCDCGCGC
jgi:hypothetical protein